MVKVVQFGEQADSCRRCFSRRGADEYSNKKEEIQVIFRISPLIGVSAKRGASLPAAGPVFTQRGSSEKLIALPGRSRISTRLTTQPVRGSICQN